MDVKEFETLVKKGLGRAVLLLRTEPDKSPFYGVVLREATEHMGYDRQSEGDRASYTRELLRAADDPPELICAVIDHADAVNAETDFFDFYHYIALLWVLYSEETDGAGAALEHIYTHFRDALIARQKSPDTIIDNELDLYTAIAEQYALLKGSGRLAVILKDMAALLDKPELFNICDFEETLSAFKRSEHTFKPDELYDGDAERVWATYNAQREESKQQRETRQASGPKNAAELLDFAMSGGKIGIPHIHLMQDATPEQRLSLARLALDEPDIEKKRTLLGLFTKLFSKWPLDPSPLIEFVRTHENDLKPDPDYSDPNWLLAFTYIRVLNCVKAEPVRSFALELARSEHRDKATELWIRNYCPEDAAAFSEFVMSFPPEPDPNVGGGWHSVQMDTLEIFDEKTPGAPDGLLRYIYESSFCACCRHRAVYHMSEKELYDDALLEEWALDSYRPTRDIALQTAAKRDR
jgi:hypothetical protein